MDRFASSSLAVGTTTVTVSGASGQTVCQGPAGAGPMPEFPVLTKTITVVVSTCADLCAESSGTFPGIDRGAVKY